MKEVLMNEQTDIALRVIRWIFVEAAMISRECMAENGTIKPGKATIFTMARQDMECMSMADVIITRYQNLLLKERESHEDIKKA